ncbi:MAG: hypothetical protein WAZ94_15240 [Phycisphaerales bacterium]|nr:hypothetical protein [Chloroflexota bacterium]
MESLRELFVALGLDWDAAGFAQAQVATDALEKAAQLLVSAFQKVAETVAESVLQTAEFADNLSDAAVRTGASVEALQELGYAAGLSGASSETMNMALTRLSMTMGEAAKGSKEAMSGFSRLGVKVTDAEGKLRSTDAVFTDLASAVAAIPNPTERTAKALDVFGRAGIQLLPLLNEGADGIQRMRTEARELGIVMGGDAVSSAAEFNDNLDRLRGIVDSLKRDLGAPLIDALSPVVEEMLEWVRANREMLRSRILQFTQALIAAGRALLVVIRALVKAVEFLVDNWKLLAIVIGSFVVAKFVLLNALLLEQLVAFALNSAAAIAYGAVMVATGLKAAAAWLAAAAPVILLTALLTLLALAAEDVYVFLQGGDSLIGDIGPKWTKFLDEWLANDAGDGWFMTALKAVIWLLTDIGARFPAAIAEWKAMIVRFFSETLPNAVKGFVRDFPVLGRLFSGEVTVGGAVAEGVSGYFGGGSSPAASASASAPGKAPIVNAPSFNGNFVVQAAPGQNAQEVASATRDTLDDWWDTKMRAVAPAAPGS